MRKAWVVSIVMLSLVFAGMACSILEREVPLDNTVIVISERMDLSSEFTLFIHWLRGPSPGRDSQQ